MSRPGDIANGVLLTLALAALVLLPLWLLLLPDLPPALRAPGTPALQSTAILGAVLLLVPLAYALAKRSARTTRPSTWLSVHAVAALAGTVLVFVHAGGRLLEPPALLLLNLVALMALGLWGRTRGARHMADTFATKHAAFSPPDTATRARLEALIARKRELLNALDPTAREATFSVTLAHWRRHPVLARRYVRLAAEEARLMGQRGSVGRAQAWWRPLHLMLSTLFLLGLAAHVILVTFFAGWVADGGDVYWWHITRWGG